MITIEQYFGRWINHPDATPARKDNANKLLKAVSALWFAAEQSGVVFRDNPHTECCVSGETYGGFRPQSCAQGATHSSHKEGLAVDIYDPKGEVDDWCIGNLKRLEECGIYIEAPSSTAGWSHWTIHPPASGHRVFLP